MTNGFSFDISFEKFNEKIKVNLSKGINVFYGESGSGKTELINTLLSKKKIKSNNYKVTNKNISEYIQLVFQNPENQIICPNLLSEVSFGLESQAQSDSLKSELSKIQSYLPFVDNWLRHPNTLSGGEMEILNIVTAFTSRSDTVFIDDGLSYLNASIKKNLQFQMANKVRWTESIKKLEEIKEKNILEIGPGKVLSGLINRISNGKYKKN